MGLHCSSYINLVLLLLWDCSSTRLLIWFSAYTLTRDIIVKSSNSTVLPKDAMEEGAQLQCDFGNAAAAKSNSLVVAVILLTTSVLL